MPERGIVTTVRNRSKRDTTVFVTDTTVFVAQMIVSIKETIVSEHGHLLMG